MNGLIKRTLILSIAFVISVGAFLPLFTSVVSANINTATPTDEATSTSYYRTLRTCINNEMITTIKLTASDNGVANPSQWFTDNYAYGYVYPQGKMDCKAIAPLALKLWGWGSDYSSFLRLLGFTYSATNTQWTVANRDQLRAKFDSAVQAKYYGVNFAGDPVQSGAARYVMFLNVFNKACNAKDLGPITSITNSSYKAWISASTADMGKPIEEPTANISGMKSGQLVYFSSVDVVDTVNGQPKKVPHGYAYQASSDVTNEKWNGAGATSNGDVRIYGYQNASVIRNCHEIQKGITDNASAWIDWKRQHPDSTEAVPSVDTTVPPADGPVASSCLIEGLGWIVCPVINLLAAVADQSFTFLSDSFLKTDPNVFNTENGTYKAWSIMRNIANILFVIAFLFIVFSQLTGMGVSNYGVKKMLPRIVIAAILVNVSYFISQLAIDVSNILGYSIRDVFNGITFEAAKTSGGKIAGGVLAGGEDGFVALAGTILGFAVAGAAIYLMLAAFGPIILAVVLALILILFILVARQAIVILLVILSPIAFVAFLLPNTESLFKQWKKIFIAMLMLFPIIALVFGVSKLASTLLQESFTGVSGVSADATNVFGQIISSAVLVLPLFAVPILLKKSLDSVPMLGQMANKMANKSFAGVGSKVKEGNRGSIFGRGSAIRKQGRENYRSKRFAEKITGGGAMGAINRAVAGGIPLPYDKAGQASRDSLQKVATAATYRAQVEEVEDAKKLIESENLSGLERQELAMKGTVKTKSGKIINGEVAQKAAIQMQLAGAGSMSNIHEIVGASSGTLSKYSQTIGQGALASSTKDPALSGKSIDDITQGTFNHDEAIKLAFSQGKYTAESVASMHFDSREKAIKVARAAEATGDPSLMEKLRSAVKGIESTPQLVAKFAGDEDGSIQLQKISGTVVQAEPTQPAKIEFKSTIGGLPQPDGTVMPKISTAQEVITQVASAGGWDKISHEDLFAAKEHATKTLSHVNDAATNKLGSDAIDEMQRRNMTPGPLNPNQGRTPPPRAPTPPPTAPPNP